MRLMQLMCNYTPDWLHLLPIYKVDFPAETLKRTIVFVYTIYWDIIWLQSSCAVLLCVLVHITICI